MDYAQAREMVARLFEHDPEKAQDILAQCCKNKEISDRILFSISRQSAGRGSFGSSAPPSLHESHHSGSHISQEIPLRPPPGYVSTPARTARSEVSHSTKGDADQNDYICLLNAVGDERLVLMKIAPITKSVIRHKLVPEETLDANIVPGEAGEVHIPLRADPGTSTAVPFLCIIQLTWRRPKSGRTHRTDFYVVAEENLDDDIIMSSIDSGLEHLPSNVPPLHSHETRHSQGYTPGLRHSAQTPCPASYHRSAVTNNDSSWTIPAQYQTRHSNQHPHIPIIPEAMNAAPSAPGGSIENLHHPPHISPDRFPSPQSIHHEISQSNPRYATVETVAPTSAGSENQPDVSSDKLRVAIKWDETRFGVWLYPDESGQAFFETLRSQAAKRKKSWDRTTTSIIFKESEEASDEKSYELFLDEDSLDADWKDIVKWLENNKKNESPHIFGTVQIEDK